MHPAGLLVVMHIKSGVLIQAAGGMLRRHPVAHASARPAQVFEVNNAVPHLVQNASNTSRIHLIVDVAEAVLPQPVDLRVGQVCLYKEGRIVC